MPSNYLTLSRQMLYDLVWSKPMSTLAQEFGITDRGLAKRCLAVDVPVPPRGYWARIAAGQTPAQIPLPKYRGAAATNKQPDPTAELIAPTEVIREGPEPDIGFSLQPRPPKETKEPACTPEEFRFRKRVGFESPAELLSGGNQYVRELQSSEVVLVGDVNVHDRAGAFATPEGEVIQPGGLQAQRGSLYGGNGPVRFKIDERMRQVPHVLTADELATRKRGFQIYPPKWDYEPSGELRVHLTDLDGRAFKTRKDGARKLLEEQIPGLLHDLLDYANREKRLRDERRLREEQSRERERLEQLAQERHEAQEKLIHELERQAGAWHRARFLRRYLTAVRRAAGAKRIEAAHAGEKFDFLAWAEAFVEQLDPLSATARDPEINARSVCFSYGDDEKLLREALSRLIGNAWQHSEKLIFP